MGIKKIFKDGVNEIKRKAEFHRARRNLKEKENIKKEKLILLGKKAWESKLDLKNFPDLYELLSKTQKNQDELDEKVTGMNQRMQEYENNKKVKNSDFDNQRKRIEEKKSKVDSKLNDEQSTLKNTQLEKEKVQKRQKQIEKEEEEEQLSTKMSDAQATLEEKTEFEKKQTQLIKEKKQLSEKIEKSSETIKLLDEKIKPLKEQSTQFENEINIIRENQKEEIGEFDTLISEEQKKLDECRKKQEEVSKQQKQNFYQLGIQLSSASTADKMVASEFSEIKNIEKEIESIKQEIQSLENRASESKGAIWKMVGLAAAFLIMIFGIVYTVGVLSKQKVTKQDTVKEDRITVSEIDKSEKKEIPVSDKGLEESEKIMEPKEVNIPVAIGGAENMLSSRSKWEVWDNIKEKKHEGKWEMRLTEISGVSIGGEKIATMLLAGEKDWNNYRINTTALRIGVGGEKGFLAGLIFGYLDSKHFYFLGYNSSENCFQMSCKTPEGYQVLETFEVEFPPNKEISLQLDFADSRVIFMANDEVIIDRYDSRFSKGKFGLGASNMKTDKILFDKLSVQSIKPEDLPAKSFLDLLSSKRGAKLISPSNGIFNTLIDHETNLKNKKMNPKGSFVINLKKDKLPSEAVYTFFNNMEAEVHKVGVQLGNFFFPKNIEFLISEKSAKKGFKSLGVFKIKPEKNGYQEFAIDPTTGRFFKIRILSAGPSGMDSQMEKKFIEKMGRQILIAEIFVYGYQKVKHKPSVDTLNVENKKDRNKDIHFIEDFLSGNLNKWEVWVDPKADSPKSEWGVNVLRFSPVSSMLINGEKEWKNYSFKTNIFPLSPRKGGDVHDYGIVFGYLDPEHFYIVSYNKRLKRFELKANSPQGFELLSFAEIKGPKGKLVPLQVDFFSGRIAFKADNQTIFDIDESRYTSGKAGIFTSGSTPYKQGRGAVLFKDFKMIPLNSETYPQRDFQDLLSFRRGASVIYRSAPPAGHEMQRLINHSLTEGDYKESAYILRLSETKLPEEAVFCFPQGRFAEIHKIGFKLAGDYFPKEIKFFTSNETPKTGFKPLTTITLEPKANSYQEFETPQKIAKYLKIQITEGYNAKKIFVPEIYVKGHFKELSRLRETKEMYKKTGIREIEPNNSIKEAQKLPLNIYLAGDVSQKDDDYYFVSLSNKNEKDVVLVVTIKRIGMIKPGFTLETGKGTAISPSNIQSEGDTITYFYDVKPDDYFLKLVQPETYLTIVYDDSGSMKESVPVVKRVLKGYLDSLKEGIFLKLIKYTNKVFNLSDFTSEPALLKKAVESEVLGRGNTDTFKGLMAAIESIKIKDGNRAIIAILDELVCQTRECKQQYIELWDAILDTGIVFSTIGVQSGWHGKTRYFGNTNYQIFSEFAYATGGEFYHSPSDELIKKSVDRIFKQMTSPVQYLVKAAIEEKKEEVKKEPKVKKPGSIQVLFEKGAEKEIEKNIELILDASNSMWGQIQGRSKIEIAREVLIKLVRGLPDKINVGLRVYGHRYKLKDRRACKDSELIVQIGKLNKDKMIKIINRIIPRGKTPLVYSILQTPGDFKNIGKGTVILISDGIESCNGDINSVASVLKKSGLDLKVHIVGFDIKEQQARKQLEMIAESTGGRYLDAKNSKELLSSLEKTLQFEYRLLNDKGKIVVKGYVGEKEIEVMEGSYTLRLMVDPVPLEKAVIIGPDSKRRFILKRENNKWIVNKE